MKTFLIALGFIAAALTASAEIRNTFLTPKGKVLIILSSQSQLGSSEIKTGIWLPDLTQPYYALMNSGYDVDLASPKGGAIPVEPKSDPRNLNSMIPGDLLTRGFVSDNASVDKLNASLKLKDIDVKNYAGVLIAGGMAAMYDLSDSEDLRRVLKDFWAQNKPIAAVHYGVYGLLNMTTPNGKQALRGIELTAVSKLEEQKWAELLGWKLALLTPKGFLQDQLKKQGAGYKSGPPFSSFVFVGAEKHLLTGQQGFSGLELGLRLAKTLENPLKPYVP